MATFSDLFARLDPDPRVRGKQFEHVCKWFLTNDPTYKNTLRKVWLWSEWTGRWGGDAGIDLVAEDRDGAIFHKGKLLERPTEIPPPEPHHRGAVRRIGGRLTYLARY